MELVDMQPSEDGQQSVLRIRMTASEAQRFSKLVQEGRLAEIGVSAAMLEVSGQLPNDTADHAGRISRKRETSQDNERTTER